MNRYEMPSRRDFDVIIIGTGAGGGTLAHRLAPSGKRILMIERGGYLPREKDNWDSRAVFVDAKYKAPESWLDRKGDIFHPGIHYYVGGNTKVYGAALFRFRERDFDVVRHCGGISPAWPLSYADFAPYYQQAEDLYRVHGERGTDPTDPPTDAPYPYPPVSHEPRIQRLNDSLERLGHHPFHLPMGVMLDESNRVKSRCIRCNTCDGFPCLIHAKADAEVVCVDPALKHPNVELLIDACVERLETSASGREVTKVVVTRNGATEKYSAGIVVVSCGAINSAALLLRSASDRHPAGLANRSDVVGRHYMCHNNTAMLALSKEPNPTIFQKTLGLNDFYFESEAWEYPMGHIQMLGKSDADMLKEHAPAVVPGMALDAMAKHAIDFWVAAEDLPDAENRVSINPGGGITLRYVENNLEGHQRLIAKLKSMLNDLDCHDSLIPYSIYLGTKIPIAGTAHQSGTVRFGRDPQTSALDTNCKAHDVDNLYVVDSSFFVSISAVNPGLTTIANALRVGDHLLDRLK